MRTIYINVYNISEHPNVQLCFDWLRNNFFTLNEHSVQEVIESVKKLSEVLGGTVEYSIGQFADRGEHISFYNYDKDILNDLVAKDLPLTGCCWDDDLITGLQSNDSIKVLKTLHSDSEYIYSDKGLKEMCEMNEYEFKITGELI
jgi:hypothetical protein